MRRRSKLMTATLAMAVASSCPVLPAYAQAESEDAATTDVRKETQHLLTALKAFTVEQRDQAMENARKALQELDENIDALEEQLRGEWADMNRAAQENARTRLEELRRQRIDVAERLGRLEESSSAAWNDIRTGFAQSYETLQAAFAKARSEFDDEKATRE